MNWHELFRYDPETGKLFWRVTKSNRAVAGSLAGTVDADGYIGINTGRKIYKAHRIIWDMNRPGDVLTAGEQIDHINHNRSDNRLCNLRKVSSAENHMNAGPSKANTSGVVGVSWCKHKGRWRAYIKTDGVSKSIGSFKRFEDAVSARKEAETLLGFHENHGLRHHEIKSKSGITAR